MAETTEEVYLKGVRRERDRKFITVWEVEKICPSCAERMRAKGLTAILKATFEKILESKIKPEPKVQKQSKQYIPCVGCLRKGKRG